MAGKKKIRVPKFSKRMGKPRRGRSRNKNGPNNRGKRLSI